MGDAQSLTRTRTRYRPAALALGFALGLLASTAACALLTRSSAASVPSPVVASAPERDPFVPLAEVE